MSFIARRGQILGSLPNQSSTYRRLSTAYFLLCFLILVYPQNHKRSKFIHISYTFEKGIFLRLMFSLVGIHFNPHDKCVHKVHTYHFANSIVLIERHANIHKHTYTLHLLFSTLYHSSERGEIVGFKWIIQPREIHQFLHFHCLSFWVPPSESDDLKVSGKE